METLLYKYVSSKYILPYFLSYNGLILFQIQLCKYYFKLD